MRTLRERSAAPVLTIVPGVPAERDEADVAALEAQAQAELTAEIEAELARSLAESLTQEIEQAESLVDALDRDLHGGLLGAAKHDRWRSAEARSDDELVLASRHGDDAALAELLTKYRAFARVKARSYFLVGADREDIVQEGMIGLYKAIRDFNPEMQTSFRAFAELCVTRQIITAIKTATRQKHGPLNNYVSFSRPVGGDGDGGDGERVLADVLPTVAISDPADLVISAERIRALQAHFDEVLSDLETEVLRLYVEGKSYQEIAERLQRHVKSIDNALQRIKRKLEGHLRERTIADAG
ncbi:MAG: polymerase, sigma-24 subunit, subfamily [Frankiales bacterium]|nr:polymerase, sigma-24 subunit, subfamily [Frankiales bacterium]